MKLYALLTLDLKDADEKKREIFYDSLRKNKWKKIENVTTAWKASFEEGMSYENAIRIVKDDLETAAAESKISKYTYAVQLGELPVVVKS